MKRVYADLHLRPTFRDDEEFSRLVKKALRLGYGLVGVTVPSRASDEQRRKLLEIGDACGVDLVSRVDLRPRSAEELLADLRRVRRRFEVVSVLCDSKSVARQAAKDRRVDFLNFPGVDFRRRFFDVAEAELASCALACLEIDVKPLLTLEGRLRVRLLSCLRREAATAVEFGVPVVLSSGVSDEFLMRKPMELASLGSLFDLCGAEAVDAVSGSPVAVVKRNRMKLSPRFVAPGIRVVRRGRDC
jgi:RNase P/RNase MRP subunit p30